MWQKSEEYAHIEDELVASLRGLLAQLPSDAASLEVKRAGRNGEGVIAILKPRNSTSAAIKTHAENGIGLVNFSFGKYGPTWELPIDGSNPEAKKTDVLKQLHEMCQAVIAGNCAHKRGFLSISGIIRVGEQPHKLTDVFIFRPTPRLHGTREYLPYR